MPAVYHSPDHDLGGPRPAGFEEDKLPPLMKHIEQWTSGVTSARCRALFACAPFARENCPPALTEGARQTKVCGPGVHLARRRPGARYYSFPTTRPVLSPPPRGGETALLSLWDSTKEDYHTTLERDRRKPQNERRFAWAHTFYRSVLVRSTFTKAVRASHAALAPSAPLAQEPKLISLPRSLRPD